MQSKLDDKLIREALLLRLRSSSRAPRAIIEELHVHNGNAVADVVAIHNDLHCYEIKGETDSIRRILQQAIYYDRVFTRITLVTTSNHTVAAEKYCPQHWGILVAQYNDDRLVFSHVRGARYNSSYDREAALFTLWRSELLDIAKSHSLRKVEKLTKRELSGLILDQVGKKLQQANISQQLTIRALKSNLLAYTSCGD